ncbi:MAG: hypothetical protein QM786_15675 [Breznakibacter sp.]
MGKKLELFINPFFYVAGWQSFAIGMAVALGTALVAGFSGTYFPDVLSVKVGVRLPFGALMVQWCINWGIVSLLMYVAGLIFSNSRPRFIDVFGTQGMARLPYFFAAFLPFVPAMEKLGKMLVGKHLGVGETVSMSVGETTLAIAQIILTIAFTVWMVAWMYRAFSVSVNLKGGKAVGIFVGVLVISVLVTMGISWYLWMEHMVVTDVWQAPLRDR